MNRGAPIVIVIVIMLFACKKNEPGAKPEQGSSAAPVGSAGSAAGSVSRPAGSASAPSGAAVAQPASAAAGGTVSNDAASAVALQCTQAAKDVKGNAGTSWYMRCPECPDPSGRIWGTDLYTDDSSLCLAAIHGGAIASKGGLLLVTWMPGQSTYIGSLRNGITTTDYGAWTRSFFVQSVDLQGRPTSPAVVPPPQGTIRMSCAMNASIWPSKDPVRVQCPPGCSTGSLWGTDIYTADSVVCLAAVHAGLATVEKGGEVLFTPGGAVDKLDGTTRNGVTSQPYGKYEQTFRLAK
jgi:hypothetical protein